jgi:hypothetical protein
LSRGERGRQRREECEGGLEKHFVFICGFNERDRESVCI